LNHETIGLIEGLAYALSLVEGKNEGAATKLRQYILQAAKSSAATLPIRLGVAT